jgi:hypothetical protein
VAPLETLHFARIAVELGICHFQNLWGNLQIDPEVSHCSTRKLLGSSGFDHHQPGAVLGVNRNTFGSGKSYKNPQLGGAVAQLCVVIFHHRYRLYIEVPISQVVTSWLVVWSMSFIFPYNYIYIGNVIIPADELTFFRGVAQPPTNQLWSLKSQSPMVSPSFTR